MINLTTTGSQRSGRETEKDNSPEPVVIKVEITAYRPNYDPYGKEDGLVVVRKIMSSRDKESLSECLSSIIRRLWKSVK